MRYPQLVVYEPSRRLAMWLREAVGIAERLRYEEEGQPAEWVKEQIRPAAARAATGPSGWLLREPRQAAACLRLLSQGGPSLIVIKLTKDAHAELALLDQVAWTNPDAMAVIVGDEEHRALCPLAWELGATVVVLPPRVGERLQEVVLGMMRSVTTLKG